MRICVDFGILSMLLFACGHIQTLYSEWEFRNLYRKVRRELEQRPFKLNLSYQKWKKLNSDKEIETFLAVREKVMDFISKLKNCSEYDLWERNQISLIEYVIRKELLKIKNTKNKGKPIRNLNENSLASFYIKFNAK